MFGKKNITFVQKVHGNMSPCFSEITFATLGINIPVQRTILYLNEHSQFPILGFWSSDISFVYIGTRILHYCSNTYPANIRLDGNVLKTSFISSSEDVLKTSSSRRIYSPNSFVFRRRLQDILIKTNIIILVIRLQDVFKTSSRHLQDFFKTFSRHLQDIFKTFWRRLQDVLQRSLQDVSKTYHQVKLFLLTRFQNGFKTYSKRFWDVLQRRLSIEEFA